MESIKKLNKRKNMLFENPAYYIDDDFFQLSSQDLTRIPWCTNLNFYTFYLISYTIYTFLIYCTHY